MAVHTNAAPPIACDLTALSSEQRLRCTALADQLKKKVQAVGELQDGYAIRFAADESTWMAAAEFVLLERQCCPFLSFSLEAERELGSIWLRLVGRQGVKEFLRTEFGIGNLASRIGSRTLLMPKALGGITADKKEQPLRCAMIEPIKWFDRQFSFDLPVWIYPSLVERMRGTPARAEDLVRALPREILTRRDGDKWSIQEHVGHLLDLEPLGMRRLDDFSARRETLSAADLENRKTWEANYNARTMAAILAALRSARSEFVQRLESFDEAFIERTSIHPRLKKPIRVLDLAFFIAEHDDHHLAQISALTRKFAA